MPQPITRSGQLDAALADLLTQAPEIEAAAVVSFDGLAMASALPAGMDEDRVAAMSAALLSLGERASEGLGRGELSQVYIEGANGTVFLVSADNEAVLVAVAAKGAKVGMMLFEVRRAANAVAQALRDVPEPLVPSPTTSAEQLVGDSVGQPAYEPPFYAASPEPALVEYPSTSIEAPGYSPAASWGSTPIEPNPWS